MQRILMLTTAQKVLLIVTLFVSIMVVLAGMIYLEANIFDGVRAYVRGEGLWAKAQKDAVLHLERYAYTHDEDDYLAFKNAIQVNLGDKAAREALSSVPPQIQHAVKGFLEGKNDPADVDSLIWFFHYFNQISYMHTAIAIWTQADGKIAELIAVGQAIHAEVTLKRADEKHMVLLRTRLQGLNEQLLDLENRFSTVLGEGARWVKRTVWLSIVALLLLFIGIGLYVSRQIIRSISRSEKALLASESRFRSLKMSDTIGIISWRMDGRIDEANSNFLEMMGYTEADLNTGNINWRNMTPNEWHASDSIAIDELMRYGHCTPFEKALFHKEGYLVPVYVGASLLEGDSEHGIAYVMNLSERKQAEEKLQLASIVFNATNDGILITDANRCIISVNPALTQITGYDMEDLIGKRPAILQSGYTTEEQQDVMHVSLETKGCWEGDIIDRRKDGSLQPMRVSISDVRNSEGIVTHYVAIMSDISERKAREEHLEHLAHYDMLTGLPNRTLFNDRIEQLMKDANRNGSSFAVLYLDLDRFKPINDTYGHKVGDRVLQIVAERMQEEVRATDTVTRIGGDEFIILLKDAGQHDIAELMGNKIAAHLTAPMHIDGHDIDIGVSIGISIYPDDGSDIKSLLHHADSVMYGTKTAKPR
ncbi:MAG TPA: diguanylate cyclase [Sulfuricurvum sp.]|nr:diguanylate cyclase [Sulfuricurvum sp.]